MRFGQNLHIYAIPEWKQCYLKYQTLKIFINILKEFCGAIKLTTELANELDGCTDQYTSFVQEQVVGHPIKQQLLKISDTLNDMVNAVNALFYQTYQRQIEITELFYQMKVIEMEEKFNICLSLSERKIEESNHPLFLSFIEYVYIEIVYVTEMRETNIEAERKILKKHKKYAKGFVETPKPSHQKINRIAHIEEEYVNKIENLYVTECHQHESKIAREFLRMSAQKQEITAFDSFSFGLWVGISISLLAVLIFIIVYDNLSIENTSVFSRDFPTWRGIAIFILYIWVLGFNIFMYEKYKISHRLIFKFHDHHYSTSTDIFKVAGSFTTLYLTLFLFYLLQITNIIGPSNIFVPEYMSLMMWGSLLFYLLVPLPILNYQGRLYALKLIIGSLISPITGVQFSIIWMTDQWISLSLPLRDFAYTICYYKEIDFKKPTQNPCRNNSKFQVVLLFSVIVLSYRILQCGRLCFQQGTSSIPKNSVNIIKYSLALFASILSFLYNAGQNNVLVAWILCSIISTLVSYGWDIKMDWQLLQQNNRNPFLRKYLTFNPCAMYYIIMVTNFVMRGAWTLTLSPDIVLLFGNSSILTLAIGSIEIIRRGIWNLLRVEKEHLANCGTFRAIPDTTDISNKLMNIDVMDTFTTVLVQRKKTESVAINSKALQADFQKLIWERINEKEQQQKKYTQDYESRQIQKLQPLLKDLKVIKKKIERIKEK